MSFWHDVGNKISNPTIIAVIIAAFLGLIIYRRQLVLNRKLELTKNYEEKLEELYVTLSEVIASYRTTMQELANLGDKYASSPDPSNTQAEEQIKKDIEKKYKVIGKLIEDARASQAKGAEIISSLASDPMLVRQFTSVANTLNKHHVEIGNLLNRGNNLLIPINTLPSALSAGQNVSPALFKAIAAIIEASIVQLQQFQLYIQDTKKLIYNKLVGGAFLFRKYKPSYIENRSVLTKKGIRDYSVETSRWLRIKVLFKVLWG